LGVRQQDRRAGPLEQGDQGIAVQLLLLRRCFHYYR
jgi:hypothetical protein